MKQANKTVLITGSSRGLGKELAFVFAEKGFNIILHGRDEKSLKSVKEEIINKNKKINCYTFNGDLRLQKILESLYEFAKSKKTSILINNAGIGSQTDLKNTSDEEIEEILTVNLNAPIKLSKKFYNLDRKSVV